MLSDCITFIIWPLHFPPLTFNFSFIHVIFSTLKGTSHPFWGLLAWYFVTLDWNCFLCKTYSEPYTFSQICIKYSELCTLSQICHITIYKKKKKRTHLLCNTFKMWRLAFQNQFNSKVPIDLIVSYKTSPNNIVGLKLDVRWYYVTKAHTRWYYVRQVFDVDTNLIYNTVFWTCCLTFSRCEGQHFKLSLLETIIKSCNVLRKCSKHVVVQNRSKYIAVPSLLGHTIHQCSSGHNRWYYVRQALNTNLMYIMHGKNQI